MCNGHGWKRISLQGESRRFLQCGPNRIKDSGLQLPPTSHSAESGQKAWISEIEAFSWGLAVPLRRGLDLKKWFWDWETEGMIDPFLPVAELVKYGSPRAISQSKSHHSTHPLCLNSLVTKLALFSTQGGISSHFIAENLRQSHCSAWEHGFDHF